MSVDGVLAAMWHRDKDEQMITDDLTWKPAWSIQQMIVDRDVSCAEVTEHFLGRIEQLDGTIHAMEDLDVAGARRQAADADRRLAGGERVGPLHGIPVAVKANFHVEGLPHTILRSGEPPQPSSRFDDIVVERLRAAGAIMFGTNTMMGAGGGGSPDPERAGVFSPFNWEAEARNPWDLGRVPGWSSSGGAAAVAAGLLPVTIGNDGGGSTRLPAAYSGVVGLHTTRGLVPHVNYEKPAMKLTASDGPLARDARDVAIVTNAIGGPDGRDYVCIQDEPRDFVRALDEGIDGLRLAWTDDFGFASRYAEGQSDRVIAVARQAASGLAALGASVEATDEVWEDRSPVSTASWLAEPGVYEAMVGGSPVPIPPPDYQQYVEQAAARARNWEHFRRFFRDHDCILSVTAQRTAPTTEWWERAWTVDGPSFPGASFAPTYCSHTMIFNWLGFPAVSVPCGFVDGLPVGLQIAGLPGREDLVLRVAAAFQHAFPREERPPNS